MWGAIIAGLASVIATAYSQSKQSKENKKLAEFQANANEKYIDKQNEYNSPSNQMQRFQDAGLNPHLMYGQGTPGNQSSPATYPDIKPTDYGRLMEAVPLFNQTRLADSQVQAQNAATRQKYAVTELNRLQARVLEKNPLLDEAGFKAIIDGLKATAEIKETESDIKSTERFVGVAKSGYEIERISKEVELLEQRFRLGQLDGKIKAEVLTSKEFQNAILEVQKKFMTDGQITPQHILQFIQLLLMKAL